MTEGRADCRPLVAAGEADLHVRDMTATFHAELTLREAQARLAEHGQWLPIDGDADSSLRTLVERDSTGPLRLGYGAWRDLLLGVQFHDGRGWLITAGGRVIKNVAGYDLCKFMAGSQGIFGQLVTVTTRTYLRPAGALVLNEKADLALARAMLDRAIRPQWMLMDADTLRIGYLGNEAYLAHCGKALPAAVYRTLEDDIAERERLWRDRGPIAYRASAPPSKVTELMTAARLKDWIADPAFGIIRGGISLVDEPTLIAAVEALGGAVKTWTMEPVADRRESILRHLTTNAVERSILERLKAAFDPQSLFPPLPWQAT